MLAIFCLRLACGLVGALLLLPPALVNPRFYRTQYLTVLGLAIAAAVFLHDVRALGLWIALGGTVIFAFLGSLIWSLEGAPAGRILGVFTGLFAVVALRLANNDGSSAQGLGGLLAGELSSAALLGTATTAMLMGHSYLIAPSMSLKPLLRLVAALFVALLLRAVLAGIGLWYWTGEHSLSASDEVMLFLPVRWAIGFVGPLVLAIMAWQTARIRSTQSATGILYVVVFLTFLGELIGQVLLRNDLLYTVVGGPLS
jgi:hypothetical protein